MPACVKFGSRLLPTRAPTLSIFNFFRPTALSAQICNPCPALPPGSDPATLHLYQILEIAVCVSANVILVFLELAGSDISLRPVSLGPWQVAALRRGLLAIAAVSPHCGLQQGDLRNGCMLCLSCQL